MSKLEKQIQIGLRNLEYWKSRVDLLKVNGSHYFDRIRGAEDYLRRLQKEQTK